MSSKTIGDDESPEASCSTLCYLLGEYSDCSEQLWDDFSEKLKRLPDDKTKEYIDLAIKQHAPKIMRKVEKMKDSLKDRITNADLRILQISDIHMGLLHSTEGSDTPPHKALISELQNSPENQRPHICVVTGDLTSISIGKEFDEAVAFLNELASDRIMCPVENISPKSRILVVPGNHDNKWDAKTLSTDKLESFKSYLVVKGGFITPFGIPESLKSEEIEGADNQVEMQDENTPPFSILNFPKLGVEISLMTSSYYSGDSFKGEEGRKLGELYQTLLSDVSADEATKTLREIIELDDGEMPVEYTNQINNIISDARKIFTKNEDSLKIAITHHPIVPIGTANPGKESNRIRLFFKKCSITVVLHGHAHAYEKRPDGSHETKAIGIGCPALSAKNSQGSLGVLWHCFNRKNREFESIVWTFDPVGSFIFNNSDLESISALTL